MAGGFPGGEVGLKIFNATGEVPKTQPATIGPIGGTLGILVGEHRRPEPRLILEAADIDVVAVSSCAFVLAYLLSVCQQSTWRR